jgi:hypothetical protein
VHRLGLRQQLGRVDAEDLREDVAAGDAPFEGIGDRLRLLVDFLEHVVRVVALLRASALKVEVLIARSTGWPLPSTMRTPVRVISATSPSPGS